LLVSKGYLGSVIGPRRTVVSYKISKSWPPEPSFFQSGPVGFVFFSGLWFRYYVSEYISKAMSQLETQAGVLQLGHNGVGDYGAPNINTLRDAGTPL
jgi:hypothetical protein